VFGQIDHFADVFRRRSIEQFTLVGTYVVCDKILVFLYFFAVRDILRVGENIINDSLVDVQPTYLINIVEVLQFFRFQEKLNLSILTRYIDCESIQMGFMEIIVVVPTNGIHYKE